MSTVLFYQNRERVFTVSILGDADFNFPPRRPLAKRLKSVLEDNVDEKYYFDEDRLKQIKLWEDRQIENGRGFRFEVKDGESIGRAVTTSGDRPSSTNYVAIKNNTTKGYLMAYDGDGVDCSFLASTTRRGRVQHGLSQTLPASSPCIGVLDGVRIRKLTPKESYRLMGFDDSSFDRANKVITSTQLYKTAGNSIVVPVLEAILVNLLKAKNG